MTVKVTFSDGDHTVTPINGTQSEIVHYYLNAEPQDYDHTGRTRFPVKVEFPDVTDTRNKSFAKCKTCKRIKDEADLVEGVCIEGHK